MKAIQDTQTLSNIVTQETGVNQYIIFDPTKERETKYYQTENQAEGQPLSPKQHKELWQQARDAFKKKQYAVNGYQTITVAKASKPATSTSSEAYQD